MTSWEVGRELSPRCIRWVDYIDVVTTRIFLCQNHLFKETTQDWYKLPQYVNNSRHASINKLRSVKLFKASVSSPQADAKKFSLPTSTFRLPRHPLMLPRL